MHRNNDPALVTVGLSMGSIQASVEKIMATTDEAVTRGLHMARLAALMAPTLIFCAYIHEADMLMWLMRLGIVYGIIGLLGILFMPEQLYTGLGLGAMRWLFELLYPEMVFKSNGTIGAAERGPPLVTKTSDLDRTRVRVRLHSTARYLSLTRDGWAVTTSDTLAITLLLQQVTAGGKRVPDTYTLKVSDPGSDWNQSFLSFQAINHLRFGGWFCAYRDARQASPYKLIHDSSCPAGTVKLLCACTGVPPPTSRYCTGFYLAEQLHGSQAFLGHGPDQDAALLCLVEV